MADAWYEEAERATNVAGRIPPLVGDVREEERDGGFWHRVFPRRLEGDGLDVALEPLCELRIPDGVKFVPWQEARLSGRKLFVPAMDDAARRVFMLEVDLDSDDVYLRDFNDPELITGCIEIDVPPQWVGHTASTLEVRCRGVAMADGDQPAILALFSPYLAILTGEGFTDLAVHRLVPMDFAGGNNDELFAFSCGEDVFGIVISNSEAYFESQLIVNTATGDYSLKHLLNGAPFEPPPIDVAEKRLTFQARNGERLVRVTTDDEPPAFTEHAEQAGPPRPSQAFMSDLGQSVRDTAHAGLVWQIAREREYPTDLARDFPEASPLTHSLFVPEEPGEVSAEVPAAEVAVVAADGHEFPFVPPEAPPAEPAPPSYGDAVAATELSAAEVAAEIDDAQREREEADRRSRLEERRRQYQRQQMAEAEAEARRQADLAIIDAAIASVQQMRCPDGRDS